MKTVHEQIDELDNKQEDMKTLIDLYQQKKSLLSTKEEMEGGDVALRIDVGHTRLTTDGGKGGNVENILYNAAADYLDLCIREINQKIDEYERKCGIVPINGENVR